MMVRKVAAITTKTLLLINSEPNLGEVLQACLMDLGGWKVLTASSVLEALRQAVLHPPDAIILELSRTGIEGFWLLEQLRAQPTTQHIPVVLLTARTKWLDSQLLERYQVTGVIPNSVEPARLCELVASLLGWDLDT